MREISKRIYCQALQRVLFGNFFKEDLFVIPLKQIIVHSLWQALQRVLPSQARWQVLRKACQTLEQAPQNLPLQCTSFKFSFCSRFFINSLNAGKPYRPACEIIRCKHVIDDFWAELCDHVSLCYFIFVCLSCLWVLGVGPIDRMRWVWMGCFRRSGSRRYWSSRVICGLSVVLQCA